MNLQLIGTLARLAALAVALPACAPPPQPQYVNDPAYARRAPPAGRPGYLATIKYIDDGLRRTNSTAGFFVSPDGRMCFRGVLNGDDTILRNLNNSDWCLPPTAVSRIDSISTSTVQQLHLICKHSEPQCIREIGYSYRATSTARLPIVPADQEKAAIEHLIYLMGGELGDSQPFR